MIEKPAQTRVPIASVLARRWSARAIDASRPVSREDLVSLVEAARWAPSCFGDQPWRYLVWDRFRDGDGWQKAFACLADGNKIWAKDAPVLLASVAAPVFRANGKPNHWNEHDTGAASENLCLQAVELGLVSHQMGGFHANQLKTSFGIPEDHSCMAMIAIGHPASADKLTDELRAREQAPRERLPLEACFFEGGWGQGVELD